MDDSRLKKNPKAYIDFPFSSRGPYDSYSELVVAGSHLAPSLLQDFL